MKKKVAFVMGPIYLGGAERALINMLKFFDFTKYDVTLFICGETIGQIEQIKKDVKILYIKSEFCVIQSVKPRCSWEYVRMFYSRCMARFFLSTEEKNKYYFSLSLPKLSDTIFDCVIAYRGWDDVILRLSFNRLYAKKRIIWMHNDEYNTDFPFSFFYRRADRIFCVSQTIRTHMLNSYTGLKNKIFVFSNIIDIQDILEKSTQPIDMSFEHPAILSVGRLSEEKGFEKIPNIALILKDKGYKFKWYIIGEGYMRRIIELGIRDNDLQDNVILLGAKSNPYPYFKECDIFVLTSIREGYGLTIAEAKIFDKKIVTTNIPVMREHFEGYLNGIIAQDMTNDAIAKSIEVFLSSSDYCKKSNHQSSVEKTTWITDYDFNLLYNYI